MRAAGRGRVPLVVTVVATVAVLAGVYLGLRAEIERLVTTREIETVADEIRNVAAMLERALLEPADLEGDLPAERLATLDAFVRDHVMTPDRTEVIVWSRDGRVQYSNVAEEIGEVHPEKEPLFDRLAAERANEPAGGPAQVPAYVELEDGVHETYVLVAAGDAEGMLEVYVDFGAAQASIDASIRRIELILLLAVLGLAAAAFPLARHLTARFADQELERRNSALKDLFLAAVSHELRTPLHSVLASTETLATHGERMDPERRTLVVDALRRNASRLDQLLGDLLDLRRLTSGAIQARRHDVDVAAFVDAARSVAERPTHRVETDVRVAVAHVDPAMLERSIENLLLNAIRHTPSGTTVRVAVQAEGEDLVLRVSDDGPGVPEEHRARILEPFERGDNPQHAPGTGLGLAVVREFARLHGGDVSVAQSPEGGASFTVRFADALPPRDVHAGSAGVGQTTVGPADGEAHVDRDVDALS